MHEAYKVLLGYGRSRHYTIWTRIGEALNDKSVCDWEEHPQLISTYQTLSEKFEKLAGDETDKAHRELTYHYNADMKQVYYYTVSVNSIEEASVKYIAYADVLNGMMKLCEEIERCFKNKGYSSAVDVEPRSMDDSLHLSLIQYLSKNKELPVVLDGILNDVKPIDDYVQHIEKFKKLNGLVDNNIELPEVDNILVMLNLYLTVLFMRADMAAITKTFLLSKTSGEAMLNMRRYVITTTAAFGHLYGYSENERSKSIWASVLEMIPPEADKLKEESAKISGLLEKVVRKEDMDVRTCYAHLFDNKTNKTNIPTIVESLKSQNPVLELQKVSLMLQVTKVVMDFIKELMEELSKRAHESNEKSTAELKETMMKFKTVIDHPNCPEELKKMMTEMIEKVKGWTGIEI